MDYSIECVRNHKEAQVDGAEAAQCRGDGVGDNGLAST